MSAATAADRSAAAGTPGPGQPDRERPDAASWLREAARSAAAPVACAAVLIGLLSAWVATGSTRTITPVRIQISQAAVPMRGYPDATTAPSGPARTFLTIRNLTSQPDELIAVRSPVARHIVLRRGGGPEDPGTQVPALTIPARSTLILTPFGNDVVLQDPVRFETGSTVPLTLTFRHAGQVTVDARVTAPGTP